AAAFRVWAARVARGERPDLLVVPLPLLHRGDTTARLLALEPRLGPLIRELRVSGKPSEYALSSLEIGRASCRERIEVTVGDGIRDFHVTGVQTCALPI